MKHPRSDCWYQSRPIGHNPLGQTIKKLCTRAGATGYYTNHSLRRTCETRLYNKGIDEQQIMSITGHRSIDGVRVYKEICHNQQEQVSKMLDVQPNKKFKNDNQESLSSEGTAAKTGQVFNFSNCVVNMKC